ncbi:hypothetical protein OB13_17260 [Pontibacter sp. HJ8]
MKKEHIAQVLTTCLFLSFLCLTGCSTSTAPAGAAAAENRSLAPQRVDIRGTIVMRRYDQGQVMLEVDGFAPSPDSRYTRAYVLVQPTAQIIGSDGGSVSISEIQQGQNVAILLRGRGKGNNVGMGIARKVWIEGF